MVDIYEYLGRSVRKSNEVDSDVGLISDTLILPGGFSERINIHLNGVKQLSRDIDFEHSFIMNSRRAGVLSTNLFGVTQTRNVFDISNGEDTYYETLTNDTFINNSETTANVILNDKIELGSGDVFQTDIIYFSNTSNCTAAKFLINTGSYNLDSTQIYLRNGPTNDWQEYNSSTEEFLYFDNIGNQLECKLISSGSDNFLAIDASLTLFKIPYLQEQTSYTFIEYGERDTFYDIGSSNDMIINNDILNPYFRFDLPSSVYISKQIPVNNTYNNVKATLGSYINGSVEIYISNDNKETWTVLPENINISLSFNANDKAYIKLINNSSNSITSDTFTSTSPHFEVIFQHATGTGSDVTMYQNDDREIYKLTFTR